MLAKKIAMDLGEKNTPGTRDPNIAINQRPKSTVPVPDIKSDLFLQKDDNQNILMAGNRQERINPRVMNHNMNAKREPRVLTQKEQLLKIERMAELKNVSKTEQKIKRGVPTNNEFELPAMPPTEEFTKKDTPKPTKKASPKPTKKASPKPTKKAPPKPSKKASPKPTKKASPKSTKKTQPKKEKKQSFLSGGSIFKKNKKQ